ncbi:MAG: hypothetical protein EOP61_06685, partial [Sphingomonadales bacterium]
MSHARKALIGALLSMVSTTAMAQDLPAVVPEQDVPVAEADGIVVTGSRIKQDGFTATVPTVSIDQAEIETSGFTDLGQVVADMPGVNLSDTTVGQPNGTIQNSGIVSIDLRDLGSSRTLTLINGRRAVSNASNRNVVSLNSMPVDFVERVEVITGAASAVYGSDAIAGVVNVITESKLDGVRLRARMGSALSEGGGAEELTLSATFGKKFADGRGYFSISGSYDDDGGLMARDRYARATRSWAFSPSTNLVTEPSLSTDIPGGRFRSSNFYYDATGLRTGFVTDVNGYNDQVLDTLRIPRTTKAVAGKLRFEVSDAFVPFVEAQYSNVETFYSRAAYTLRDTTSAFLRDSTGVPLPSLATFVVGRIPLNNTLIPTQIRTGAASSGIDFRRRLDEVGPRDSINKRDTVRVWTGATGDIGGGWSYELSYGYGRFDQEQQRKNGVNLQNVKYALDVETVGGVAQCRNAAARTAGCTPLDLFGIGSISTAAANYIRLDSIFTAKLEQHDVMGYVTGPLFRLPAGEVSLAIGGEYRKESSTSGSDIKTLTTINNVAAVPSYSGGYNVKEAFAELSIPVLKGVPFFQSLNIDLAGRAADYSQKNVGTVFSYHGGLNWEPVSGLRLRAQYGVAQRAPNISELYSPPRDDTDTAVDICTGVRATTTGTVAANCRSHPGVAATIATAGVFNQSSTSIQSPNTGNLALKEETGTTFTLGGVLAPRALPGFDLSVDYYNIKVKDAISALDNEILLRQCYSDASTFSTNEFCKSIIRDSATGQILQLNQVPRNLDKLSVSGIDFAARYRFDLDSIGIGGRLELKANWTHVLKDETTYQGLNGTETATDLGQIGAPQDVVRGNVTYSNKLWDLGYRVRYIAPMISSNERLDAAIAAGFTNPLYMYYPAYWRHDIHASITPKFGGMRWKLSMGINNLLNDAGPDVPTGATPNDANGYIADYGVVGRTGYVAIQVKF